MRIRGIAIAVLSAVLGASVGLAQTAAPANQTKVFDFTNKPSQQGLQEIATILRTVGDIKQLSIDPASSALTVSGTTDQLAMTGWILHQLDQPIPADLSAPQPGAGSSQQYLVAGKSDDVIQVFHLTTVVPGTPQMIQEILTVLRTVADVQKVYNYTGLCDLVVRGQAADIAFSQYLISSLDVKPGSVTTSAEFQSPGTGPLGAAQVARVFYLAHPSTPQHTQEILTTLRTVVQIQKVFNYTAVNALAIRASASDLAASGFIIQSLDIPAAPNTGNTPNIREFNMPAIGKDSASVIHVYYLANSSTPQQIQEMLTVLRTVFGIQRTFSNSTPPAVTVRGSADQVAKVDQEIQQLNKPLQTATAH
jgi:type II secretory pathway component GspD/PulD (secretin)